MSDTPTSAPAEAPKTGFLAGVENFFARIERAIGGDPQAQASLSQAKDAATTLEGSIAGLAEPAADAVVDTLLGMVPGGSLFDGIGNAIANAVIAKLTARMAPPAGA